MITKYEETDVHAYKCYVKSVYENTGYFQYIPYLGIIFILIA